MKRLYTYIGLLLTINLCWANSGLEQDQRTTAYPWTVRFDWANDFVFQTDRYFTNGMALEVWGNHLRYSPLNYVLIPHKDGNNVFYGLSFLQDIFTPMDTRTALAQNSDRPYSSYWLIGGIKKSYNADYTFGVTSSIYFGMAGSSGGGEWVQNGIHDLLPTSSHVNGWDHQLNGSFCLDYQLRVEKELYRNPLLRISGSAGGIFGTPYTNLDGGFIIYAGKFGRRPGLFFVEERLDFHIYGFAKTKVKWALYDATLQGGLFSENRSSLDLTLNPFVIEAQAGITAKYRNFSMELGQKIVTPEFSGAKTHKWGYVSLSVAF